MNRTGRRRRATIAMAVILTALVAASVSLSPAGARPQADPAADPAMVECPDGLVAIDLGGGGPVACSHGPDPGLTPAAIAAESGPAPEAAKGIQCYGNGTDGKRVQLVYVYATTNRLATLRDRMIRRAAEVDAIFDASAQQTGGRRFVRWVTDANCELQIRVVQVPATDLLIGSYASLFSRLANLGSSPLNDPNRKYLVWTDTGRSPTMGSGSCSGVASMYTHDVASPTQNYNNRFTGHGRVDETCLFALFDPVGGKLEAHELMHTLGAVQSSAPNATAYGHCRDDYDIMCYVDGPGTSLISPRPCAASTDELRFDCRDNDYFSTNPPAGSYLATRWNAANSSWLSSVPGTPQAPSSPQGLTGVPGNSSVALRWTKPQSDGGQPVLGYVVYRNGQRVSPTTTPTSVGAGTEVTTTTPSFSDTGLANGTTYRYQVAAVNAVGEGPKTTAASVMAGVPRPDAMVGSAKNGSFNADNVYFNSMAGNTQTLRRPVARGGTVTSFIRVQNDRPGFDSFQVKGVASGAAGYTVRYFRGTTNITSAVVAGTYTIDNVAPGAFVDLKVKVTATRTSARGSTRSVTVTVKSRTTKTIKDVVQTRAVRR